MCPQVSENQAARFMAGRAEIIDELEGSLPAWLRRRTMSSCYPTYIHFLKVNTALTTIVCMSVQHTTRYTERQLSHGPHALPAACSPCEYHITVQATSL